MEPLFMAALNSCVAAETVHANIHDGGIEICTRAPDSSCITNFTLFSLSFQTELSCDMLQQTRTKMKYA